MGWPVKVWTGSAWTVKPLKVWSGSTWVEKPVKTWDGVQWVPIAVSVTAPVLAMDPAWLTTDATPDFTIDVDDTVTAGDDIRLQIQASGGGWSVLLSDTTHTITAPEDTANEVNLSAGSLANGNYEARCNVTHGTTSAWSNTVSFTIAAVGGSNGLYVYPYLLV